MLTLALVFQTLAIRKPHLDSGIFIYAKEGFGNYLGFTSALGFWAGTCIGNVSYFVLIKSTLGTFSPIFGDGNTLYAILTASVVLWCFHILVLRGVKEAAIINTVVTWAKIIPIGVFIVVLMFAFNADIFTVNFWGYPTSGIFTPTPCLKGIMTLCTISPRLTMSTSPYFRRSAILCW